MAITGQELRSAKPNIWRNLSGPLLAASAVVFVEILLRVGFKIPNPPAIFRCISRISFPSPVSLSIMPARILRVS